MYRPCYPQEVVWVDTRKRYFLPQTILWCFNQGKDDLSVYGPQAQPSGAVFKTFSALFICHLSLSDMIQIRSTCKGKGQVTSQSFTQLFKKDTFKSHLGLLTQFLKYSSLFPIKLLYKYYSKNKQKRQGKNCFLITKTLRPHLLSLKKKTALISTILLFHLLPPKLDWLCRSHIKRS